MTGRLAAAAALLFASALPAVAVTTAAHAAGAVRSSTACAAASGAYRGATPWAQRLLDPARIWPIADGSGQTVAVIGTGIDAHNAQFGAGQVLSGRDLLSPAGGPADSDCDGRGTFAAGLVAARADPSTTFAGLAPGARLLPVRYTQTTGNGTAAAGDPGRLAAAIDAATEARATVVLIAVPAGADSPALRAAVGRARAAGAVLVSPAAAGQAGAHTYPTADPGVIAVGAIDEQGAAVQTESGDELSLAAPGVDLVGTAPTSSRQVGHTWPVKDPTFAAAFVAGSVALLRSADPALTPDQVAARLTLTADRPPSGTHDPRLGWGTVNPYLAITADLPADAPGPGPASTPAAGPARRVAPAPAPPPRADPDRTAGVVVLGALALAVLTAVTAATVRHGRARGWRPARLTPAE